MQWQGKNDRIYLNVNSIAFIFMIKLLLDKDNAPLLINDFMFKILTLQSNSFLTHHPKNK